MRIIDLLNKIANGEEVPKKIKYIGYIFEYDTNHERYEAYIYGEIYTLNEYVNINDSLNDEVEVCSTELTVKEVEENLYKFSEALYKEANKKEEKKIPEKLKEYGIANDNKETICEEFLIIKLKINEIIDFLKSKGE